MSEKLKGEPSSKVEMFVILIPVSPFTALNDTKIPPPSTAVFA